MSEKIKKYPGTRIATRELREGKVPLEHWRPSARYSWALGVAMSRFLEELKMGKIIARKCNKCGRVVVPPRIFCELCFKPNDEWVYVADTGAVNTYSISYLAADASRIEDPILVAVIELDGASKGIGLLHNLGELEPQEIKFGMRVKAVWKPPKEREGAITDIKYFKPFKEEC